MAGVFVQFFFIDDNDEVRDTGSRPGGMWARMWAIVSFFMGFGVNAVQGFAFIGFIAEKIHGSSCSFSTMTRVVGVQVAPWWQGKRQQFAFSAFRWGFPCSQGDS
jgi:hypothetical protein